MGDQADTAVHEAVHACVACALGKKVEWLRIAQRPVPGRPYLVEKGGCKPDPDGDIDRDDLAILLAAGMYEAAASPSTKVLATMVCGLRSGLTAAYSTVRGIDTRSTAS